MPTNEAINSFTFHSSGKITVSKQFPKFTPSGKGLQGFAKFPPPQTCAAVLEQLLFIVKMAINEFVRLNSTILT